MEIVFPVDAPLVRTPDTTVGFKAIVNGVLHQCEISEDALEDQFDAPSNRPADLFAAFDYGRDEIEMIARRKIEMQGLHSRILITNDDF